MNSSPAWFRARTSALRRWVAVVFLLMMAFYLTEGVLGHCHEGEEVHHQVCTLVCSDGCATAPIPVAPAAPPPDALPRPAYAQAVFCSLRTLEPEPEKEPPRI